MKKLILTGGTGSEQIQTALIRSHDPRDVSVLINMYDNGLSTGAVRRAHDYSILGPSDLRKNQTFFARLIGANTKLADVLSYRMDVVTEEEFQRLTAELERLLYTSITRHRHLIRFGCALSNGLIGERDVCFGNIVYGGLLYLVGDANQVSRLMADALGIPRSYAVVNSDTNMFLYGMTADGMLLPEEDIVQNRWGPIEEIRFFNRPLTAAESYEMMAPHSELIWPTLCHSAERAISQAKEIVISTGTFWSSIYPTAVTRGFVEAVGNKRVLGIVNLERDGDAPQQSLNGLCSRLENVMYRDVEWYADVDQKEPGNWYRCLERNGRKHDVDSLASLFAASEKTKEEKVA